MARSSRFSDLDRVGVHRHVHAAEEGAHDRHRDGQHGHRSGAKTTSASVPTASSAKVRSARREPMRAITAPGKGHGDDRSDAQPEDQQAQRALGDVVARQQQRNLRRPGAEEEAVGQEHGGHGPAAPPGVGMILGHRAVLAAAGLCTENPGRTEAGERAEDLEAQVRGRRRNFCEISDFAGKGVHVPRGLARSVGSAWVGSSGQGWRG